MKAGVFFTSTGPILLLTSYDSLTDPKLVNKLDTKGIKKFIAYEVDEETLKEKAVDSLQKGQGKKQSKRGLTIDDLDPEALADLERSRAGYQEMEKLMNETDK